MSSHGYPGARVSMPNHIWCSAAKVCEIRSEPLPDGVGADELVHITDGELHLLSDCTEHCPAPMPLLFAPGSPPR